VWDDFDGRRYARTEPPAEVVRAVNALSDELDPGYASTGLRNDWRLRILQDYIDPLPEE